MVWVNVERFGGFSPLWCTYILQMGYIQLPRKAYCAENNVKPLLSVSFGRAEAVLCTAMARDVIDHIFFTRDLLHVYFEAAQLIVWLSWRRNEDYRSLNLTFTKWQIDQHSWRGEKTFWKQK